ncbi:endonuclease [Candidatus Campbellbacteria bacterium CG11_big_fil_rev_8_21_14_0_20_44_21]|uniref:Endonuclease n=1 Tax=Candidatus Campbellbacteria bacterium CG22_combo_CG10-13_8_21_14_all_43_18 TaxID=1974530 RepID=A0A2H0DWA6_9BACT|nr:MAG: endonuclease [Candidatus Campbellbacteria bacterium CG22_combo_CG10-13_8_21_14_all_43_18]PIR24407.1 MAG: endonuclease [Candidatus Campbellbacteria bacterium CG11_big_fil_rev_8_21_14_0_20_44_21]
MISLYILKNNKGRYYIGITSLKVEDRPKRHNSGYVTSTRLGRPWRILCVEEYKNWKEARNREKQIKS